MGSADAFANLKSKNTGGRATRRGGAPPAAPAAAAAGGGGGGAPSWLPFRAVLARDS
jgi:hypothetical protein